MKTIMPLRLMTTIAVCSGLTWGLTQTTYADSRLQEQAPPWMQPDPAIPTQVPPAPRTTASSTVNAVLKSAQGGHPRAQYDLAMMYQTGQGVKSDLKQSTYWLNRSAQGGEPDAQYLLSQYYYDGTLGRKDMQRALYWGTESAKRGHIEAQYWLGVMYVNGEGVKADTKQGKYWLQHAAKRGSQDARVALQTIPSGAQPAQAVATYPPQNPVQSTIAANDYIIEPTPVPDYAPAAAPMPVQLPEPNIANAFTPSQPNPEVIRQVQHQAEASGERINLNGMNPNDVLELANSGDRYAQFLIGALYEEGSGGFTQSYREAARWYRRAARQEYPKAQYNLALLYEDGRGVEQDYKQAGQWYAQAAKGGFTKAKNNLGILYVTGKGVRRDNKIAEKLFKQAAQEGDADAAYNLSRLVKS